MIVKTNFGGILADIEDSQGITITTQKLSREMPISYGQALSLRKEQTKRFDALTLQKFFKFCLQFGVTVTPNDIFQFVSEEQPAS